MDHSQYAELFLAESREHLSAVNELLLTWERDRTSSEPVAGIFRAVHTIKGMAATMNYATVADLAHEMEGLLDVLRRSREPPAESTIELLFQAADALEAATAAAVAGRAPPDAARLLSALGQAAGVARPVAPVVPADAATPLAPGAGLAVQVTLRADAAIKGARAMLVLRRAQRLGTVHGVQPPTGAFEREGFNGIFAFRLDTSAPPEAIESALREAGDVERVLMGAEAEPRRSETPGAARHVRLDLRRLDALMTLVGEFVTVRGRLAAAAEEYGDPGLEGIARRVWQLCGELQTEVLQARMTPVWQVFDRFPRLVRDLARGMGKQVDLTVEGKDIELDRAVLDELADPLVHLLRNAVDHGIEAPADRVAAGKSPAGHLRLSAARERDTVAIEVGDDGRGVDRAKILEHAITRGLVAARAEPLSDDELARVLARPGFSTKSDVTETSGRGVGMDAVVTRLRALGGALELTTEPGVGSTFTLRVPTSLAITQALVARVGEERYALPLAHVTETLDLDPARVTELEGREALAYRDGLVPLLHLREVLRVDGDPPSRRPVLLVELGGRRSGVVVDAMLGQQEILIKPFVRPRGMIPVFNGATLLGDGTPVLILDAAGLLAFDAVSAS